MHRRLTDLGSTSCLRVCFAWGLLGAGSLSLSACDRATAETSTSTSSDSETGDSTTVSFAADVAPIFAAKCNHCHHADNAIKVDLNRPFDDEQGIINRPNSWPDSEYPVLVVPGDADASALTIKVEQETLEHDIEGDPMPFLLPRLTTQELADLRQWIEDGAEPGDFYDETITLIFGDGSLGSKAGKCVFCHYTGGDLEPDLSKPFDPVTGIVGVPSAFGGIRVRPGDPDNSVLFMKVRPEPFAESFGEPMPLQPARVTDGEAATIRTWIDEGARAN